MNKLKAGFILWFLVGAIGVGVALAQQTTSTNSTSTPSNPLANRSGVITVYGVASGASGSGLTLTTKSGDAIQVTFNAAASVWVNGKVASPTDIQNGMTGSATGQIDPSHTTLAATMVKMNAVRYSGLVSNLGQNSFSLTMAAGTSTRKIGVNIGSNSIIIVNGDASSLASLENGMAASIYGLWTDNTMTAVNAILMNTNSAEWSGVVTNIGSGSFVLSRGTKSETINIGSNTILSINRRANTLTSTVNGMQGTVYGTWIDITRTAINADVVSLSHASISGHIAQVNGNQIVVVNSSEKPFMVNVAQNATVIINGFPSTSASIQNGMLGTFNGTWSNGNQSSLNASAILLGGTGSITSENDWCFDFNRNLGVKNEGNDVENLQHALNLEGFNIDESGNYDEKTAAVVSGFQEKYRGEILTPKGLAYGTGYVGAGTRRKLNALYGCNGDRSGNGRRNGADMDNGKNKDNGGNNIH